jgi:hypothetical protein
MLIADALACQGIDLTRYISDTTVQLKLVATGEYIYTVNLCLGSRQNLLPVLYKKLTPFAGKDKTLPFYSMALFYLNKST